MDNSVMNEVKHTAESGFMQKILTGCKQNTPLLFTVLFALLAGIGWLLTADTLKISDLCLNLLAGFISSGITIGVIERIIHKQKESKDIPLQKAMYRDVQLFASRLIGFWQEVYVQSTEIRTNITIEELFDPENVITMSVKLNLNGYPNISPKQNWFMPEDEIIKLFTGFKEWQDASKKT